MKVARNPILIVEDNGLIAMDVVMMVESLDLSVVGPAATVDAALDAVRGAELSGAILDVNLGDERVWPVAELLDRRGVPFVLATGYGRHGIPARFAGCAVLSKPYTLQGIDRSLRELGVLCH